MLVANFVLFLTSDTDLYAQLQILTETQSLKDFVPQGSKSAFLSRAALLGPSTRPISYSYISAHGYTRPRYLAHEAPNEPGDTTTVSLESVFHEKHVSGFGLLLKSFETVEKADN